MPLSPELSSPTSPASSPAPIPFNNTYARLPDRFFARVNPRPVAAPRLIKLNADLARSLGIDPAALSSPEGVEILAGNRIPAGAEPLAIAYAGHQFGHFVPSLGDGRANLLGEVLTPNGQRFDIQLKGSGPTPFSRRGDGRAALGPVLREYLLSEAMAALGVPTTRALAAVLTGEQVLRETVLPGAVFTRVAASHLRVGTFQYFAARNDAEALRTLADFAIQRHYPEAAAAPAPYTAFLHAVIARQASLVAHWLLLGFIHGVMNTDNTSISGETIDYGPCAFMEAYHPGAVFSSIDAAGRYAFANQPGIALWNLTRLAESLLPILETETGSPESALATAALTTFEPQFHTAREAGLRRKLGLLTEQPGDTELANDLLERMAANEADYTLTFHLLNAAASTDAHPTSAGQAAAQSPTQPPAQNTAADARIRALFTDPTAFDTWATTWRARLASELADPAARASTMRLANPLYIPRNHLVQEVITAAIDRNDFQPFEDLLTAVTHPFDPHPNHPHFALPARPEQRITATFCGT